MADVSKQHNQGEMRFRCADVGDKNCQWEARGQNEDDIMRQVERHGREAHNLNMDEDLRQKVRGAINRKAA
jgi:predicted small metal-binding protein